MAGRSLLRPTRRRALGAGAALVVLMPGLAYANVICAGPPTLVTVRSAAATAGPTASFAEISTDAHCAGGLISGGGIYQTLGDPTQTNSNGNHVNATSPSADGSTELIEPAYTPGVVAQDVTYWLGIGGSGGATQAGFSSTPYAVCFVSSRINHTQVVMNALANQGLIVATCPTGTRLLGGGARATPASSGSMKPVAGYPTFHDTAHDLGAKAAGDGNLNPDSWAVYSKNGGGGGSLATYAYAICSATGIDVSHTIVTVRNLEQNGPLAETAGQNVTVGCNPGDGKLIGGGAAISSGNLTTADIAAGGSQGDHLTGSYPSDAAGNPVADGTTTAAYWTAATHTGGTPSAPPTFSDAWAMCATGT